MTTSPEPKTAIDTYKAIIDPLAQNSSRGLSERIVCESGTYSSAEGHVPFNASVTSLKPDQRELLATMLREERVGAIHNVLAELAWWLNCRDVG